jgi:hypothetical protein
LQAEHPGIQGFSRTSLFAMRQFYLFLSPRFEVVPQPVGQLPWGHICTILGKIKEVEGPMSESPIYKVIQREGVPL